MADALTISVKGVDHLDRALKALPAVVERRIMSNSIRDVLRGHLATVKGRTPVLTGRLRRSLRVRAGKRRRGRVRWYIQTGTREVLGIGPEATAFYPASLEYGSRHQPPRPYLRFTSADQTGLFQLIQSRARSHLDREIQRLRTRPR